MWNDIATNGLVVLLYKSKCGFPAKSLTPNKIADNCSRPMILPYFPESDTREHFDQQILLQCVKVFLFYQSNF